MHLSKTCLLLCVAVESCLPLLAEIQTSVASVGDPSPLSFEASGTVVTTGFDRLGGVTNASWGSFLVSVRGSDWRINYKERGYSNAVANGWLFQYDTRPDGARIYTAATPLGPINRTSNPSEKKQSPDDFPRMGFVESRRVGQDRHAADAATAGSYERELYPLERVSGFGPHHGRDNTHQEKQGYAIPDWSQKNARNTKRTGYVSALFAFRCGFHFWL